MLKVANRYKFKLKPKPKSKNINRNVNKQNKQLNKAAGESNPPNGKKGTTPRNQNFNDYMAHAPYNFVPLNTSVIPVNKPTCYDMYYPNRFTGYIDCELEALTPIYIRGTLSEDEVKNDTEAKNKYDFFSPSGIIRIPGSSLRGMIRNLLEIASWSKFVFYEDKNLYYRSFADISSIRNEYKENMNPMEYGSLVYKMSAGYLVKKGFNYSIYPAEEKQFEPKDVQSARKLVSDIGKIYSAINYYKLEDGRSLIVSGRMPRKKDWIINKIDQNTEKEIEISETDIKNYEMDVNRNAPSLLEWCEKDKEVPCFYVPWVDAKGCDRVSFGHTALFRIPYKKSIKEHIPLAHHENKIDFAHAIFGTTSDEATDSFAGRVFFEDGILIDQNANPQMEERIPKILLGPKSTSFQLYLEQNSTNKTKLKHYNSSETCIRGNKFYWHRSGDSWKKDKQNEFNPNIETKIRAVEPTTRFISRIRFENLSEYELGALLFVLKLPHGCAHKIGMGKPLGLGTIKINSKVYISNRKTRYLTLFDNRNWSLGENEINDTDINKIISSFEEYVLQNIDVERGDASSLWETNRLKQLSLLLDVEMGKKFEKDGKIDYMPLKEFRSRNVLPHPENI